MLIKLNSDLTGLARVEQCLETIATWRLRVDFAWLSIDHLSVLKNIDQMCSRLIMILEDLCIALQTLESSINSKIGYKNNCPTLDKHFEGIAKYFADFAKDEYEAIFEVAEYNRKQRLEPHFEG